MPRYAAIHQQRLEKKKTAHMVVKDVGFLF